MNPRNFWTHSMDMAFDFMQAIRTHPVQECREVLVSLPEAVRRAGVEVTFSDKPHVENLPRLFYMREGLLDDFLHVAEDMNRVGWVLHVEDAYRTRRMQRGLGLANHTFDSIYQKLIWERNGEIPSPEFMFRRCTALVATCPKIGTHMSGSAMDISVFRRSGGEEVWRGAPYLEMSERTPMDSPFVEESSRHHRRRITELMEQHGFVAYPFEFWHYSKADAYAAYLQNNPALARYGPVDFDPEQGRCVPIDSPNEPLITHDEIQQKIRALL